MSNQIRITPEQMRRRAREYNTEADNLHNIIVKMDNLLNQLESEWEGSASRAYAGKYRELKPGFKEAEQLIRDISSALSKTASAVEETDKRIANAFK